MDAPPITAKLVKELVAHRERDKLDFKEQDYNWDGEKENSRKELAKDLMAMANRLSRGDDPSYILIGVREKSDRTGEIVGLATPHLPDADLHQKVNHVGLNRVPNFVYAALTVDDLPVGVYQILPGGRPYYFMIGSQRYHALQRVGSSTNPASPDEIYQWARADDPISEELRMTKLEETQARVAVRGNIKSLGLYSTGRGREQKFCVVNYSQLPFTVQRVTAIWGFNHGFFEVARRAGADPKWRGATWEQHVRLPECTLVPSGHVSDEILLETYNSDVRNEFLSDARIVLGQNAEQTDWRAYLECKIEVVVDGAGGQVATLPKAAYPWSEK